MKKILTSKAPLFLSIVTFLTVTVFLRYSLHLNSQQLSKEFLTQNAHEIYSIDTLKISSRLNSFSKALNWVCIDAEVGGKKYFNMNKGSCSTGLLQQKTEISIPEANDTKISFTLKLSHDLEQLYEIFFIMQIGLIFSLFFTTKKAEEEKLSHELEINKISRKMFHDIRSPLATLNSISDDASFKLESEDKVFKNAIVRINEIANSLLEKTHKVHIQLPSFQYINLIIEEIINEKKIEFSSRNINITAYNSEPLEAYFETTEFKRILSNIINNAVEACVGKPILKINISVVEKDLFVDIKDNGTGISQKIISKIGKEEISSKSQGNGLGFKEAAESVREWGGEILVLETSSEGTTVRIKLQSKIEVLPVVLIDDDELTRMTWEIRAKKKNLSLRTFSSIELFEENKKHIGKNTILYIDSELGEVKGEELASELHKQGFQNISICSGHPPDRFKEYVFLKSIISKTPPF